MKDFTIQLSRIDSDQDFRRLAEETEGRLEDANSSIHFSGALGRGHIKKYHLEPGLHMRVWDLFLTRPVDLQKEALPVYVANKGYSLFCILTPESADFNYINQQQQFNKVREKSFALMPDTVNASIHITPQLPVQVIDFAVSSFWLKQQPGYAEVSRYLNDGLMEDNGKPAIVEPCLSKHSHTATKLFAQFLSPKTDEGALLTLSTLLIRDFLNGIAHGGEEKTHAHVELYYDKVKEVETIIITHLQKALPRLDNIAQKVALSESTLKRYFKLIYGRSIYEYYLNRKMEMARNLLLQKPLTVSETAEMMGYEKVSNFIDIFKKYHGYSPGSIKRKMDGLGNIGQA